MRAVERGEVRDARARADPVESVSVLRDFENDVSRKPVVRRDVRDYRLVSDEINAATIRADPHDIVRIAVDAHDVFVFETVELPERAD